MSGGKRLVAPESKAAAGQRKMPLEIAARLRREEGGQPTGLLMPKIVNFLTMLATNGSGPPLTEQ